MSIINKIAPSIICCNYLKLQDQLKTLESCGIKTLHVDVMDGNFVKQITIGSDFLRACKCGSKMFMDVHLMVNSPINHIEEFVDAGADCITFHYEACKDLKEVVDTVKKIKSFGIESGIAIQPDTPADVFMTILEACKIDKILVMSVQAGLSGQSFKLESIEKVQKISEIIGLFGLGGKIKIEIDGGINKKTLQLIKNENVDIDIDLFVVGSATFKDGRIEENLDAIANLV